MNLNTSMFLIAITNAELAERLLVENEKLETSSQPRRKSASFWSRFAIRNEEPKFFIPMSQPCPDCGD